MAEVKNGASPPKIHPNTDDSNQNNTMEDEEEEVTISTRPPNNEDALEEARKEEIREEIRKIEDEIATLHSALERKERHLADLKRELGITTWSTLSSSVSQKYHDIQNSGVYQKTAETVRTWNEKIQNSETYNKLSQGAHTAGEKTASAWTSLSTATSQQFGKVRESQAFQKLGTKVSSVSSSLKYKMLGPQQRFKSETSIKDEK